MKNNPTSFEDMLATCKEQIQSRRQDLNTLKPIADKIIDANCPFEYLPEGEPKLGVLLIHGLLDCPFSLRDIGQVLAKNGMRVRSVLLPGHGTRPEDLLHVTYQEWLQTVQTAIASLKTVTPNIALVGYSTGAALSLHEAMLDPSIRGLVLLSPAIRVKAPVNLIIAWHYFTSLFSKNKGWICKEEEIDYAKYLSVPFNAVDQVNALTNVVQNMRHQLPLKTPIDMVVSREDETISGQDAIRFFEGLSNPDSRLLLYSANPAHYADKRIISRVSRYPQSGIQHLSHTSIPFSPHNLHYGQHGDYTAASHPEHDEVIYGAYNRVEIDLYGLLYKLSLTQHKRRELTYNPDFEYMAKHITQFLKKLI